MSDECEPTTLARLATEVCEWHRKQFPDLPSEIAERKVRAELEELFVATAGWRWRSDDGAKAAVLEEAADSFIAILGLLRFFASPEEIATAADEKWAKVRKRNYAGAASAMRTS